MADKYLSDEEVFGAGAGAGSGYLSDEEVFGPPKNRSYLGAALESGVRTLGAAGATVLDAINPFTLSEEDAATLYKDDPEGFKRFQEESAAAVLQRFAAEQTKRSREVMQEVSPDETGAISGKPLGELEYATLDPEKAAYLSPTRVAGDVLQSLPSTLALAVSGYFTRGKALQAYEQALARETAKGVTKAEAQAIAKAEAVREGAKSMAVIGGGSEGVVTGAQQYNQALDQVGQLDQAKIEQSPEYQALLDEGYAPETARATLANRVATQSGVTSGVTTGLISAAGGRYLGGLVGEGGSLLPRVGKGFLIEGATEAPQSTLEQINQNVAMQRVDPSQNILEGAGEAAAAGFVVGGVTGGAFGAAFGGGDASRQRQKVAEQALREAPDAATAAAAANELAGSVADLESAIDQYLTPTGAIPTPEQAAATPAPEGLIPREDPTRAMIDRQAGLIAQAQAAPTAFDRQLALDQAQTALPQPQEGRSAGFVDLTPMNDMQAQQRLAILRDETARAGGNALALAIVPHPAQANRFAIAEQALPDLSLPQAETNITPDQAQFQIESAALGGQVSQARAEDSATRGPVIDQALKAVEARGGVASPAEAQIFQEAGIGQPYDRVDPALGPAPAPLIEPAGASRESFTPNQQIADQEVQADQQARRQSDLAQRDRQLQGQIAAAGQARPAPDAGAVISALVTPGRQRSAEQVRIVNEARNRYSPEDFSILERAATAPFQLNTPERMRLRELRNPPAVPQTSTTVPESGTGLMGTRVAERLGQPSGGRIITTNAKLSTQRVSPGGTVTINDGGTQHEARVVEPSRLGTQGRLLQQIARLFNKRLVAFESDTLQADGFVRDGDNDSIYINAKSQISVLAVFGHELTHLLKRDNPQAYAALEAVVRRELREGATTEFAQETGYDENASLEELTSDLVGNRFQEPDFWQSVFDEIAAQNPDNARGIVARLAAAINRAINAFRKLVAQPGFDSDQYIKDISAVKRAVNQALVAYMQQPRLAAEQTTEQAVAEVTREIQAAGKPSMAERLREAARAARTEMGETVTASRTRATPDSWKATSTDVEMAEEYESRTGMDPYLSGGQLEPRVANAQFSVKRPYAEKDLAKGKENHPILGLPLNKNGTVTLYYPATNAEARRVAQDKRLRGATPQSNRIYLTNESSGPKVMQNRGGMDQDMDGANVLIQVDPSLLHLEREYEDGRKDFFIQLAEGESFARKMKQTKLFTLDAPRTRALSKDTKLTDLERRISSSVEQYLALDSRGRRARLAQAKDVLRREHNVGTLLGENGKLQKTRVGDYGLTYDDKSVASMGLGLASAQKINEQNLSTCPKSAICEGLCLGETSGQNLLYGGEGQFKSGPRLSQYLKTEAMVQHPEDFAIVLHDEIAKFEKWANSEVGVEEIENEAGEKVTQPKQVYQAAIRLNVTSDFRPQTFEAIINAFPNVMFYDYTKLPTRAIADNHHLTYSSTGASQVVDGETIVNSESNWDKMVQRLNDGLNVAMAFTSRTSMPSFVEDEATGQRFQVWDGDNYDARFLDPKREDGVGMIIGLTNKDRTTKPEEAAKKYNGFFLDYDADRDGDTLVIPDQKRLAAGGRKTISIAPARQQVATTDASAADQFVQFSRRRKPAPKKTVKAYKLFRVDARKPGQLFPLFVNANDPVEIGVWLDADEGPLTEKGKVKSKIGDLAYRPGWHAGDVPIATHIGGKSDPSLTAPDVRPDNHVWAEVEMAADRDWQKEADKRGTNAQGRLIAGKAHITDQIPTDGFYRYKTNPNMTGNWLIGGSMKVNRVLNDAEVKRINDKAGVADLPREAPFDAKKYGFGKTKLSRQRGINVRNDGDNRYADFIVDGEKTMESRDSDSLRPYVGRTVGIIRTGEGPAKLIGTVKIGEPVEVDEQEFRARESEHLVPEGSEFDIKPGSTKFLYPLTEAERFDDERDVDTLGIVARQVQFSRQRTGPFYSQLAEAIDQVPARLETQPAQQWKAWLASNASKLGIKKDEIEWSGINDYLDLRGKDKVTKAEIAEYLDDNGVEVGEVLRDDQLGEQLETKFEEFQLPGGQNYGELMLNLPDEVMKKLGLADYRVPQLHRYGDRKSDYNRLAHVRFNDRTDVDGNRVLFIEEIQSDWAQEGRKRGFGAISAAPFVQETTAWVALAVKRMLVFAARNGYDKIAFINGEQSADRYDLSKRVDRIDVSFPARLVMGSTGDAVTQKRYRMVGVSLPSNQTLKFRIDDAGVVEWSNTVGDNKGKALADIIGKEMAEKVMAAEKPQAFEGLDLKVGGGGMKKFYDQIVPQVVNDVLKKVGGGKLESVEIRGTDSGGISGNDVMETMGIPEEQRAEYWKNLTEEERDTLIADARNVSLTQPGFTITPEMRDKVEGGMPLFSRRRNPQVDTPEFKRWSETNGSVIKDADGEPLVLYRGGVGSQEMDEKFLNAEPRPGYATFASSSPFVANSYANPDEAFSGEVGAVAPVYVKARRLIEFPVGRRFDKFEFDNRAKRLQPGEVLVARQVYDYGPRASVKADPEKLYSYPSDIYAWRSAAVKSVTGNSGAFSDEVNDTRYSRRRNPQVDTPEFKRWFGDSKVVDENGDPLVVYHGTDATDIESFDPEKIGGRFKKDKSGFWFAINKSEAYSGGVVYPAYLSLQNPLTLADLKAAGLEYDGDQYGDFDEFVDTNKKQILALAKEQNADGLFFDYFGSGVAVAFEPTQIKSATGNIGTFDPANPDITQSRRRNYGSLNAAQEQALRNVGGIVPDQTLGDRLKELGDKFKKSWFSGIFDQFAPLKDVDQRAYMLARLSKGSDGALEALMLYGKPFMNGDVPDVNVNDEGFIQVMASLKGEHDRFLWWVAAQRAENIKANAQQAQARIATIDSNLTQLRQARKAATAAADYRSLEQQISTLEAERSRLENTGQENLFTDQDISSLKSLNQGNFEDGTPRGQAYANALAKMNDFNDAVLNIAEQSGLIDGQARQLFKDMPYVPFYRVMEDGVEGPSFSSGLVNQQAWKKLKGGTQKLNEDLLSNVLLNWAHLFDAAGKNRAAVASMQAATQIGIAQQVPAGTKGAVKVMEQGQTKHYTIDDPYIMEAVTALNYQAPGFFRPFSTFKKWLTIGVTASPTFKIKNLMRDSLQAIGTAPMSYNVASNVMKGFKQGSQETQTFASMLAGGGLIRFGSMLEGTGRTNYMIERQGGILLNEGGWKKLQRQMTGLVEAYAELGDRLENVNRVSLYEHLLSKGYSQAEANFMSRDLMDFSLQGRWPVVRFLAQSVPFLNARLQGLSKLGRGAKEDPRRFGYVVGAVALASIALMLAYEDDEDWKKRPDWDRDSNWWFKIGDTAFRIPKPFEIGAIGTVAERTWELAFNDEMTWKRYRARLSHMIFETFAMDPTPQLVVPIAEIYANKEGFTGRPIEGMSLEKLRPEDRATESTSSVARMLGQMGLPNPVALVKGDYEKLSPVQIDHLVRGYFGWIGTTASNILDFGLRPLMDRGERPAYRLKDVFVVGNFAEGLPAGSSRYVDQLYEQARIIEQAYMSYRDAVKKGDRERAKELLAEEGDKIRAYKPMNKITDRVSEINRKIRQIDSSRTLSAETKRKMIDQLSQQKDRVARQAQRFATID